LELWVCMEEARKNNFLGWFDAFWFETFYWWPVIPIMQPSSGPSTKASEEDITWWLRGCESQGQAGLWHSIPCAPRFCILRIPTGESNLP
jgi:hypothetical protein